MTDSSYLHLEVKANVFAPMDTVIYSTSELIKDEMYGVFSGTPGPYKE